MSPELLDDADSFVELLALGAAAELKVFRRLN
jgi:hypothetical protein